MPTTLKGRTPSANFVWLTTERQLRQHLRSPKESFLSAFRCVVELFIPIFRTTLFGKSERLEARQPVLLQLLLLSLPGVSH